jgi:hypothetical protein
VLDSCSMRTGRLDRHEESRNREDVDDGVLDASFDEIVAIFIDKLFATSKPQ